MSQNKQIGIKRYKRQIPLIGKKGQEALKNSKVFIAGAGGLGSPAATYIALAGVGFIRLVDRDVVKPSNMNRQFLHYDKNMGLKKSDSGRDTLQKMNHDVNVEPLCVDITKDNIKDLAGDCDIIVDALDNNETRAVLSEFALSRKIPLVHGSVHGFHGEVSTYVPGNTNPCPFCLFNFSDESENSSKIPIIGAVSGIVGSVQALEVIKYITGSGNLLVGKLFIWDGKKCISEVLNYEIDPECRYCKYKMEGTQ